MSQEEIAQKVKQVIAEDPKRDHIQSISLFGSYLRGTPQSDSDIDLLFEMRKTMSLFEIFSVQRNLEKKLGREVDFIEKNSLDKYIRADVLAGAKKIYSNRRSASSGCPRSSKFLNQ